MAAGCLAEVATVDDDVALVGCESPSVVVGLQREYLLAPQAHFLLEVVCQIRDGLEVCEECANFDSRRGTALLVSRSVPLRSAIDLPDDEVSGAGLGVAPGKPVDGEEEDDDTGDDERDALDRSGWRGLRFLWCRGCRVGCRGVVVQEDLAERVDERGDVVCWGVSKSALLDAILELGEGVKNSRTVETWYGGNVLL